MRTLRGRTHELATAACVVQAGGAVCGMRRAGRKLTMRQFSDAFLDDYLAAEGEALLGSVGAYRLEGRGCSCSRGSKAIISRFSACRCSNCSSFCASRGCVADDEAIAG